MTLDWSIKSKMGLDNYPYKMLDGRGTEVRLPVLWCDTDTGEIGVSIRGLEKQLYEGAEDGKLLEARVFLKAPLRIFDKDRELT